VKFNEYFPNVVLINLDRRVDRLEQFDKQAKELGIEYERFSAVDLKNPVAGCRESHLNVVSQYDYDPLFIFEDDALFVEGFSDKLPIVMSHLPEDWDALYLGAHILDAKEHNEYWLKSNGASSTHAYAVRGRTKDMYIQALKEHDGHSDRAFSNIHKDLNVYIVKSTLIWQTPGYSDIQECEVNYDNLFRF
jgi:GR25 family glycosyltransferase involved in LPS biosynthesis